MRSIILRSVDVLTKVSRLLAILATICLTALMLINFFDIVGTKWFSSSIPGTLDISEELTVFLALLPLAYIVLERGNIKITLLEERVSQTARYALAIFRDVVGILVSGFLTWRVFLQFKYVYNPMQYKQTIDLPIWPANLAIVVSFGFLALALIMHLAKTLAIGQKQQ